MHWFLVFLTILPKVLIFWTSTHSWTWRVRTLLTNCAINQIDAIEWRKINKTGIIINVMEIFLTDWRNRQHERLTNRWNLLLEVIAQPLRYTWTVLAFQFDELCWILKTYSSQINSGVERSLSLFVQRIFQCPWLKLLFRSERFPFVKERTKIDCKIHFREWLLLQISEKEQLSIRFVFDFCQLTSNQNAAFERLREIWKFTLRMCYSQQILLNL